MCGYVDCSTESCVHLSVWVRWWDRGAVTDRARRERRREGGWVLGIRERERAVVVAVLGWDLCIN